MTGKDLVQIAELYKGHKYVLGALPFRHNAEFLKRTLTESFTLDELKNNIKGPHDCAEFVCLVAFLTIKLLYGANNNSYLDKLQLVDAWTNFFKRDFDRGLFTKLTIAQAANTPGAILLRYTKGSAIGHIVISKGDGTTIEAHSRARGVANALISGRTWDCAFTLKELSSICTGKCIVEPPKSIVYRLRTPYMESPFLKELQVKLKDLRFYSGPISGKYGPLTMNAVTSAQRHFGIVIDGMCGPETAITLGLKLF